MPDSPELAVPRTRTAAAKPIPYRELDTEFWSVVEGFEYALPYVRPITRQWAQTLRNAARAAWHIYTRVASLLRLMPDDALLEMGFPSTALPVLRTNASESLLARFDFIEAPDGFKVIELNAETPFFYYESFALNGIAVREQGFDDPNAASEAHLIETLRTAVAQPGVPNPNIVVTAYNVYREDFFTAAYIARILEAATGRGCRVAPVHELHIKRDRLHDAKGPIDVLYRCYPLEHFAHYRPAARFFSLIRDGRLSIINPPGALLQQTR